MLAKMDAGLFTLQQCAIILAHLWGTGDVGLRKRILMLLHQKGQTLANIKSVRGGGAMEGGKCGGWGGTLGCGIVGGGQTGSYALGTLNGWRCVCVTTPSPASPGVITTLCPPLRSCLGMS